MKEESEKAGLKLSFQKTKIMASGLITSWQIGGQKVEIVTGFLYLGSKITADGNCSQEIKRCFLLGRNAMTNPDSVLKTETSLCQQITYGRNYGFSSESDNHSIVSGSLQTHGL